MAKNYSLLHYWQTMNATILIFTYIMKYQYKKHRGGSMRATILPSAIILTKACRDAVSVMAKGCIVA